MFSNSPYEFHLTHVRSRGGPRLVAKTATQRRTAAFRAVIEPDLTWRLADADAGGWSAETLSHARISAMKWLSISDDRLMQALFDVALAAAEERRATIGASASLAAAMAARNTLLPNSASMVSPTTPDRTTGSNASAANAFLYARREMPTERDAEGVLARARILLKKAAA